MKKVAALFSIFAVAAAGNVLAVDIESGSYPVDLDTQDAYDCGAIDSIKWEQLPNGATGMASQDDVCYPFAAEVADNFMGDGADVVGVGWWGVYWNGSPLPPDGFNIRIYADNGGTPGDLLYQETAATYNETQGDPYGYCANLAAPFRKADGVGYHLSVQAQFCFPPQWGYSSGDGDGLQAHFKSAFFGFPDFVTASTVFGVPYEGAFLLYNDGGGGTVPTEDATWTSIKGLYR